MSEPLTPETRLQRLRRLLMPTRRAMLNSAAILLLLAAIRPEVPLLRPVHSFFFVVDISMSMHTRDMHVDGELASRAAAVRHSLTDALRDLPCGTRAGLGVFAGYQTMMLYKPVEVCGHYNELASTVAKISPQSIWASDSEIAKGVYNAMGFLEETDRETQLVFITDGHEAPPISARYRPQFRGTPDVIKGWLVGVGELTLSPIPKIDDRGRQVGVWREQEVAQQDPYTTGRSSSTGGEKMVDVGAGQISADVAARLQNRPGREHLSELRETYLKLLAEELGFDYARMGGGTLLAARLIGGKASAWHWVPTQLSQGLGALAALCLLFAYWRSNLSPLEWTAYWLTWPWRRWRARVTSLPRPS
ncbi:MAG: VWA domain-containing protein [Rhodocyclaceae bacterium]|nr:VWA domain-containing protein [Rhodocyclaceae bacterium]